MQKTDEIIAKYAIDANLFRLGSPNPKKNCQTLDAFWWRSKPHTKKKIELFFSNIFVYLFNN